MNLIGAVGTLVNFQDRPCRVLAIRKGRVRLIDIRNGQYFSTSPNGISGLEHMIGRYELTAADIRDCVPGQGHVYNVPMGRGGLPQPVNKATTP